MFPCGSGKPPEHLAGKFERKGYEVLRVYDNSLTNLKRAINQYEGPVILHGWSLGGKRVLDFLIEHLHEAPGVIGAALYAPTPTLRGPELSEINIPVLLCHNSFDGIVPLSASEYVCNSINSSGASRAVLKILDLYSGEFSSHHSCEEFDDVCIEWMNDLLSE